jgi:hypothetical protein
MARQAAAMPSTPIDGKKICGVLSWLLLRLPSHSLRSAQVKWWNNYHHPPRSPPAHSHPPAPYFLNSFQGQGDEKNSKNKGAGWVLVEHGGLAVAAAVAFVLVGGSSALAFVCRYSVAAGAGSRAWLVFPACY